MLPLYNVGRLLKFSISLMADWGPVGMWMKPGKPVGNPCGQARGQAKPVHRLSISGCPRAEHSEPGVRAAIIHISTGPGVSFCRLFTLRKGLRFIDWRLA